MLYTGSFSDIGKRPYDEVWLIVRSLKAMPKGDNIKHVPELSPSWNLFKSYLNWKERGIWNHHIFETQYKPEFIRELSSYNSRKKLKELIQLSEEKDILCVCYCKDESLCHRSIVKDIAERIRIRLKKNEATERRK